MNENYVRLLKTNNIFQGGEKNLIWRENKIIFNITDKYLLTVNIFY